MSDKEFDEKIEKCNKITIEVMWVIAISMVTSILTVLAATM